MDRFALMMQVTNTVAAALSVPPELITPRASFDALGLDSMDKVNLIPTLERLFDCSLDAEALFDFPNVDALADHIASVLNARTRE